jgi:hypothetical protein
MNRGIQWKLRHPPAAIIQAVSPQAVGQYYEASAGGSRLALFNLVPGNGQLGAAWRLMGGTNYHLYLYEGNDERESARFSGNDLADLFNTVSDRAGDVGNLMDKIMKNL